MNFFFCEKVNIFFIISKNAFIKLNIFKFVNANFAK